MGWNSYDLVTFGCSHTYGQGLPDCVADDGGPGPKPSNVAWPSILKRSVGFKSLNNRSRPGASNKIIVKRLIEYPYYNPKTVVVILWSNFSRQTIFKNMEQKVHMMPHMADGAKWMPLSFWKRLEEDRETFTKKVDTYYKTFYEDFDAKFDQMIRMNFAHAFLKSKGIKSFHLVVDHEVTEDQEYFNNFNVSGLNLKIYNWQKDFRIDYGLDTANPIPHPGPKSHMLFANNIKEWFFK